MIHRRIIVSAMMQLFLVIRYLRHDDIFQLSELSSREVISIRCYRQRDCSLRDDIAIVTIIGIVSFTYLSKDGIVTTIVLN